MYASIHSFQPTLRSLRLKNWAESEWFYILSLQYEPHVADKLQVAILAIYYADILTQS